MRERLQADCYVISSHDCSCAEAVSCLRRKLKEHSELVARHESAYNKAQEDGRGMEGRLPQLKQQAAQLDKDAAQAAQQAQHHSDGEPSPSGHTTGDLCSPPLLQYIVGRHMPSSGLLTCMHHCNCCTWAAR